MQTYLNFPRWAKLTLLGALVLGLLAASATMPPAASTQNVTPTPNVQVWVGEYYDNPNLSGRPALVRDDAAIDFDWGYGSPAAGLPTEGFSARWTRSLYFQGGSYRFSATSDDGVRVWLDGELIIDEWHLSPGQTYQVDRTLSTGEHWLQVEYYENTGGARIRFGWTYLPISGYPDWKGEYYNNPDLADPPVLVRNDTAIDFDWGLDSPDVAILTEHFSVRWTQSAYFQEGNYRFLALSDDGVRVWLDDVLIIDEWHNAPGFSYAAERTLGEGLHQLRVEYYEDWGGARIQFGWEQVPHFPDWRGAYYDNVSLDGSPVLLRSDAAIDFDWGYGSPDSNLPGDAFSVRWTRQAYFDNAVYRFHAVVDGAVALWLGDRLLLDHWHDGDLREFSTEFEPARGEYEVKVEYLEGSGVARVRVWWEKVYVPYYPDPEYPDWRGQYWPNQHLYGRPDLVRNDVAIDFDWGTGAPAAGLPADQFSIRWDHRADLSGYYTFYARADNGIRVWLDGEKVLDAWYTNAERLHSFSRTLSGSHHLAVEYYEDGGPAMVQFWWGKGLPKTLR